MHSGAGSTIPAFLPFIGVAIGCLLLCISLRARRKQRLIDDIPTCKAQGVFIGLVELKGAAHTDTPVTSFLAACPCVHYRYTISEHWRKNETESYTDSKGHRRTRHRTRSGWKTVDSGGDSLEYFDLQDDTGSIRIRPHGADIDATRVFSHTCGRGDPLYYGKGPPGSIMHSTGRRSFTEHAIPVDAQIYVMGHARQRQDIVAAEIAEDVDTPTYIISTASEKNVARGKALTFWLCGMGGLALGIAPFLLLPSQARGMPLYAIAAGAMLAAWLIGWLIIVFNSLIGLRQRVNQAWAHIDVELKRRHDLIPNLAATVDAAAAHERRTMEAVAHMRNQSNATAPGEEGPDPEATTPRLMAVVEAYPNLKTSTNFLRLQRELAETEQRIALARGYFNQITTAYNTRLEVIPDGLIAKLAGMRPRALMQANGFERDALQISLE